jgi:predicted PurR-regulated permease PerM
MPPASPRDRWPPVTYWMKVTAGVLLVIGLAGLVLAAGNVLILALVSLVLALGFQPAISWLGGRGLSRGWAVTLGLLAGLLFIGLFMWLVLPDVIAQVAQLIDQAPEYFERAQRESGLIADLNQRFRLEQQLQEVGGELPGTVLGFVGSLTAFIFNSLTVLILTIYFTVNLPRMRAGVARLLGRQDRKDFREIYEQSVQRVGGYVLGNLVVSVFAGVASFLALVVIGVPFAAALAFVVAVVDLIPAVGATIGAALAATVAAFVGLPQFIATVAFFVVYQQIENYVIQPRVMGRTVELSAAAVILAVLIGGSLLGIVGALLAIPVAAIITVVMRELVFEERVERLEAEESSAGTV